MVTLRGEQVYLRALEPEDLEFVYQVENDESIWELSHTQTPYSRYLIKEYLEHAHKDIFEVKQLRLVISTLKSETIGLIDIFDFDFKNRRAGVGILIQNHTNRSKGFGAEALSLLVEYCFKQLQLNQVYCNIAEENIHSINLFKKLGFQEVGVKQAWNLVNGVYKNELLFQRINE
ncbi:GNAT family N-acetyltransferase [Formosa sp. S-31]|uniref:GNAT family N-acetyltransferase n=1 Tax=Formosa sp. S-31 TaxID=2790949 RepID=UPI003EBF8A2C